MGAFVLVFLIISLIVIGVFFWCWFAEWAAIEREEREGNWWE